MTKFNNSKMNLISGFDHLYLDGTSEFLENYSDMYVFDPDIRHLDVLDTKYCGFFYNIRLITEAEVVNFLSYYEVDPEIVSDKGFLKKLAYFYSLFYNEAMIVYFSNMVHIPELYMLFTSSLVTEYQLYMLLKHFNKRVLLEIARLFLSFVKISKISNTSKNFVLFKNYVLSNVYLFDSFEYGLHYKAYKHADFAYGGEDYELMFLAGHLYESLFEERIGFLDVLDLMIDNLVYNLYNLGNVNKNYSVSFFNLGSFLTKLYTTHNYRNSIKMLCCSGFSLTNYSFNIKLYLNSFMYYFFLLHEVFTFFRYYLYILYLLMKRKVGYKVYKKIYIIFKKEFLILVNYFNMFMSSFYEDIKMFIYVLFNEFKIFFYKFILSFKLNKKNDLLVSMNDILLLFFKFQSLFLHFFNLLKTSFFFKRVSKISNITLNMNSYFYTQLKKTTAKITGLDFFNDLFDFKTINLNSIQKVKQQELLLSIFKNVSVPGWLKAHLYFVFYKESDVFFENEFMSKNGLRLFSIESFFNIFTYRTLDIFYTDFYNKNVTERSFLVNKYVSFRNKMLHFDLPSVVFKFMYSWVTYSAFKSIYSLFFDFLNDKFYPTTWKVKVLIEDTFFLLVEEFFGDGFDFIEDPDYEFDHNEAQEGEDRDVGEAVEDFWEGYDDYAEMDDFFPMYFIEDLISVNYYINEMFFYKFSDIFYPTEDYMPLYVDWYYDFEETKLSPYFDRKFMYYYNNDEDSSIWVNSFMEPMDPIMWYDLIAACMSADVSTMSPNYYRSISMPIMSDSKFSAISRLNNSRFFEENYKDMYSYYDPINDEEEWIRFYDLNKEEQARHMDPYYDVENVFDLNLPDKLVGSDYACFNAYVSTYAYLFHYFDKDLAINGAPRHSFTQPTDFSFGSGNDSFFTSSLLKMNDFVLLHEVWAWWEIIGRSYTSKDIEKITNNKLRPQTYEEYQFFNLFVVSGLSSVFKSFFKTDKSNKSDVDEELSKFTEKLHKIVESVGNLDKTMEDLNDIAYMDSVNKKKRETIIDDIFLTKAQKKEKLLSFDYEYFLNTWSNKYLNLFFFVDYVELIKLVQIYDDERKFSSVLQKLKIDTDMDNIGDYYNIFRDEKNANKFNTYMLERGYKRGYGTRGEGLASIFRDERFFDPFLHIPKQIGQKFVEYEELKELPLLYDEPPFKQPVTPEMFVYIKRIESAFLDLFRNSVSSMIVSYYSDSKQNRLLYFWEHFMLMAIELIYSGLDSDLEREIIMESDTTNMVDNLVKTTHMLSEEMIMHNMQHHAIALAEPQFSDDLESSTGFDQIDFFLSKTMDTEYLLSNGLNIDYSFVEGLFYDIYETHSSFYINADENDSANLTQTQMFRFYEFPDDLRLHDDREEIDIVEVYLDHVTPSGVFNEMAYQDYVSMDFYDYRLGESYYYYLERMKMINMLNISMYKQIESSLKGSFKINATGIVYNRQFLKTVDNLESFLVQDHPVGLKGKCYSIAFYKVELVYYYLSCLFFDKKSNEQLVIYILKSVLYMYIQMFRKYNVPSNIHFFFLLFYINYFFYLVCNFLKKSNISLNLLRELELKKIYELINFLNKRLYIFFLFFIKILKSYWYRVKFFKKYGKLLRFFLMKRFLFFFMNFLFDFKCNNVSNSNPLVFKYSNINTTFRSYLSTLSIYKNIGTELVLLNDVNIFDYLFNNFDVISSKLVNPYLSSVENNNEKVNTFKKINSKYYNFWYFENGNYINNLLINDLESIGKLDLAFNDNYEVFKDGEYFDYEDGLDDEAFFTNEWYSDYTMGDMTDIYESDVEDEPDLLISEEEFDADLELDSFVKDAYDVQGLAHSYFHLSGFFENEDEIDIDVLVENKFNVGRHLWEFRYSVYFANFINLNYVYIRNFVLKLLNYYKNVPISDIIDTNQLLENEEMAKWHNMYNLNNTETFGSFSAKTLYAKSVRQSKFNRIERLVNKNSKVLKTFFEDLNVKNDMDGLVPKFLYTSTDFLDHLDYLVDYNNEELSDYSNDYDVYDMMLGVSTLNYEDSLRLSHSNFLISKILAYYRFLLLYINIYRYIDGLYKRLVFISYFFFDLNILFFKIVKEYVDSKKKFGALVFYNVNNIIKFIYNSVYIYKYKQLKLYLQNLKTMETQNDISSFDLNKHSYCNNIKFFSFLPIYYDTYKFHLKKVHMLKILYKNELSMYSYFLFVTALEWFIGISDGSKKQFLAFFFFIKKKLKFYESFVFFNAYKLAQIYSKYGLVDSYMYFNKMCIKNNIEIYKVNLEYKYLYLKFFIFGYEFFIFFCFCLTFFVLSIGWIDTSWVHLISSVYLPASETYNLEEGVSGIGIVLGRRSFESQLHVAFQYNWADLWGIF